MNLSVDSTPCTFKFNTLNELSQIGFKHKNKTQRGARDLRKRKRVKRKREFDEDLDQLDFFLYDTDDEEEEKLAWSFWDGKDDLRIEQKPEPIESANPLSIESISKQLNQLINLTESNITELNQDLTNCKLQIVNQSQLMVGLGTDLSQVQKCRRDLEKTLGITAPQTETFNFKWQDQSNFPTLYL